MILNSSPISLSIVQVSTTLAAIAGLIVFKLDMQAILEIAVGYFLLSCVGISIFYHRYYSHRSFKTNFIIRWVGTILGVLAGRGSPIGWVAVHRQHHKNADSINDPHAPSIRIFAPHLLNYTNINLFSIKELLTNRYHRYIDDYYNLILFLFVVIIGAIDMRTLMFLWIIPVALTGWVLNLFTFFTHMYGYRTFETNDKSTNNWFISLILWGEGWHNNHHAKPNLWNLRNKWWELDISAQIIRMIKV